MPRARKVDANQAAIVEALRKMGFQVFDTSAVGRGFADLIVNWGGKSMFVEIKNGGDRKWYYTPAQKKLRAAWKGAHIETLTSVDEAIEWANVIRGQARANI